jgi:hypothetical protein
MPFIELTRGLRAQVKAALSHWGLHAHQNIV